MHVVKCFIIKRKEKTLFHHTPAMTVSYVSTETRDIKLEAKKLKALYTYQYSYTCIILDLVHKTNIFLKKY